MDRQPHLADEVEADAVMRGEIGGAITESDDRLDHLLHRFDLVRADGASNERGRALAHDCRSRLDRIDPDTGSRELDREPVGQAVQCRLRRSVNGHARILDRSRGAGRDVDDRQPSPRSAIEGATACTRSSGACTLTSNVRRRRFSRKSINGEYMAAAALLTRTSIGPPSSATADGAMRARSFSSARSAAIIATDPPNRRIASAVSARLPAKWSCFATVRVRHRNIGAFRRESTRRCGTDATARSGDENPTPCEALRTQGRTASGARPHVFEIVVIEAVVRGQDQPLFHHPICVRQALLGRPVRDALERGLRRRCPSRPSWCRRRSAPCDPGTRALHA